MRKITLTFLVAMVFINVQAQTQTDKRELSVKTDTARLSVIDGVERLGPNPLVLIDGVEYNKEILYKG